MDAYPTPSPTEAGFGSPFMSNLQLPEVLDNFRWAPMDTLPEPPSPADEVDNAPRSSPPPRKQSIPCDISEPDLALDDDVARCDIDDYYGTVFQVPASDETAFDEESVYSYSEPSSPTRRPALDVTNHLPGNLLPDTETLVRPGPQRLYDFVSNADQLPLSSRADVFSFIEHYAQGSQPGQLHFPRRRSLSVAARTPPPPPVPPKDSKWLRPRVMTSTHTSWSENVPDPVLLRATLAAGRQSRTLRHERALRTAASSPSLARAKSYPPHPPTSPNTALMDLVGPTTGPRKLLKQRKHPHSASNLLAPLQSLTNSVGSFMHDAFTTPISIPRRPKPQLGQSFDHLFDN